MEDYEMMISPEQLKKYEESDHARRAKDLFSELAKCDKRVTQFEYCCLRDHLFTVIHFGNGHRSGVTSNLLMKEYSASVKVDSFYEIMVRKHKTFYAYGPATITLTKTEFGWMKTFVEKVRRQVNPTCENVFLSWTGHVMESGQISQRINQLWLKAGIFEHPPVKNISCNIIRKSTSTGIRYNL